MKTLPRTALGIVLAIAAILPTAATSAPAVEAAPSPRGPADHAATDRGASDARGELAVRAATVLAAAVDAAGTTVDDAAPVDPAPVAQLLADLCAGQPFDPAAADALLADAGDVLTRHVAAGTATSGPDLVARPEGRWGIDPTTRSSVLTALGATETAGDPSATVVEIDIPTRTRAWEDPDPQALAETIRTGFDVTLDNAATVVLIDSAPPYGDALASNPAWADAMRADARSSCEDRPDRFQERYGIDPGNEWDWSPAEVIAVGAPTTLRDDLQGWTRARYARYRSAVVTALRTVVPDVRVFVAWDAASAWNGAPRSLWEDPFATFAGIPVDGWVVHYGDDEPGLLPATFWAAGFAERAAVLWEEVRADEREGNPLAPGYHHAGVYARVRPQTAALHQLARLGRQQRAEAATAAAIGATVRPRIPDLATIVCTGSLGGSGRPVQPWPRVRRALERTRRDGFEPALIFDSALVARPGMIYPFRALWIDGAETWPTEFDTQLTRWIHVGGILAADGPIGAAVEQDPNAGLLAAIGVTRDETGWTVSEGGSAMVEIIARDGDGRPTALEARLGTGSVVMSLRPDAQPPAEFYDRVAERFASRLVPMPFRLVDTGDAAVDLVAGIAGARRWILRIGNLGTAPADARWTTTLSVDDESPGTGGTVRLGPGAAAVIEVIEAAGP